MYDYLHNALNEWHAGLGATWTPWLASLAILLLASGCYQALSRLVAPWIGFLARRTRAAWDKALARHGLFRRLAALGSGLLIHFLAGAWLPADAVAFALMQMVAQLCILVASLLSLYALLNALTDRYATRPSSRDMPVRGAIQAVKLALFVAALIMGAALLMGKSPVLLMSGLGAMTAVLMLVFRDPILGFVAGIQLSANRMLAVGDWLEMPKYGADGDVIDITLTTVKVRNWDQTITTVPTYALISDSFKNWRGMQQAGGRRIMRNVHIDMHSVRFLAPDDIERLRKAQLLSAYMQEKLEDIERDNRARNVDATSPLNARHLTNLGTFRAYLSCYLKSHPGIRQDMIMMVRQLQPSPEGVSLQIYAFTSDTGWVAHETVQSDMFDHILAVVPEFGLRVFQFPSGADLRALSKRMGAGMSGGNGAEAGSRQNHAG